MGTNKTRIRFIGVGTALVAACVVGAMFVSSIGAGAAPPRVVSLGVLSANSASVSESDLSAPAKAWLKLAKANPLEKGSAGASAPSQLVAAVGPGQQKLTFARMGERVCFLDETVGAGNCAGAALVDEGRIFTAVPVGCDFRVVGMVPDGVSSLSVMSTTGEVLTTGIPVVSNVYSVVLPPDTVDLVGEDGSLTIRVPLSSYAAGGGGC